MSDTASVYGSDLLGVGAPPAIPGHRLEHPLGHGGFGTVWQAVEESTGRKVAVKVAHSAEGSLAREAQCLKALNDQGGQGPRLLFVPGYIADGRTADGRAYLVQELVDGATLGLGVQRTPQEAEALLVRLLGVVGELHTQTLQRLGHPHVHADLKPGNIVLTPDGRTVLLDLGAARKVKDDGHTTGQVGAVTHGYCAPEVYAGRQPTPASDVYSLGVIGFEMLTGTRMTDPVAYVRPDQALAALERACGERTMLARAIQRAISNEPAERFATPGEFLAFLDNPWAADLRLDRTPMAPAPDVHRELSRCRTLRLVRTAALLICTLACAWFATPLVFQALRASGKWGMADRLPITHVSLPWLAGAGIAWATVAVLGGIAARRKAEWMIRVARNAVAIKDYAGAESCFREAAVDGGKNEQAAAQKALSCN